MREEQSPDIESAAYQMLGLCQRLCPTGKEQAAFTWFYNNMTQCEDNYSDAERVKELTLALCDGLQYGNWPQIK